MNIFQHRGSFYGCPEDGACADALRPLFRLAKQIRLRLGRQGYLLDNYLTLFFEGISAGVSQDAALQGTEMGGEIQKLLYQVMDGAEAGQQHPLYQRIREVYEQQKDALSFQEKRTNSSLLLFFLADDIMEYYTSLFIKELESDLTGVDDMVRFRSLYEQISRLAGESCMEELNKLLQQRFLTAPAARSFTQGLAYDLALSLASRDPETNRQMFQLLLDAMPGSWEEPHT